MKIKLNNILTLASLMLTALLLVFVVRAWYAVNKTATVEAGSGATAGGQNLYLSTTYGSTSSHTDLTTGGWGTKVDLTASNILLPASTFDATNFYYTNEVNEDGSLTLYEGIEEIGDSCFKDCNALTKLYLPKTIKKIGNTVFSNILALNLYYAGSEEEYSNIDNLSKDTMDNVTIKYME